ncbi:hypothetical protein [Clostridium sp. C2-6-12]|uniref:hypothetical protein n=1 Tax=Clostridium sp. C2-6-12 TaxID=2698832 RepID=UPI0013681F22|nr:hypothetical protein [Clostridium sp. C2-6-12]
MEKPKSVLRICLIPFIIVSAIIAFLIVVYLCISSFISNPDVNTNINEYQSYIGENAKKPYKNKMGVDESIFPNKITQNMNIEDYKMVYDNPWDSQYLSCLVVKYDESSYENEVNRLKTYKSNDYIGNYGAEGFSSNYELLAMNSSKKGFVYAITNKENTIIYIEILSHNGFKDFDYNDYIKKEYLPIGFYAKK